MSTLPATREKTAQESTAAKVVYRQLGSSGLQVSVPILGSLGFGSPEWSPWVLDEEKSLQILKAAWDKGINTIDTANSYSNGDAERIIGKFIEKYSIPRAQIVISTKLYFAVSNDSRDKTPFMPYLKDQRPYVNQCGLSRAAIFNAIEDSLARLKTPYIDLLQIHRFDHSIPPEETMKALHDLVQNGKVRYIGASSMRCWEFAHLNEVARLNGWTRFVSMQDEYSLVYREEEREMHAYCKFNGIGIIPWAPLATGALARPSSVETKRMQSNKGTPAEKILTGADELIISRVDQIAQKKRKTMAQISLAWVASKTTSPIVSINGLDRLEGSLISDVTLEEEEIEYLEELYETKPVRGHR